MNPAKTAAQRGALTRFHAAHMRNGSFDRALREIRRGDKRTHWMWYIFPQHAALAKSDIARFYGITSREEAVAYFEDPVLRWRLFQCTAGVLQHSRLIFAYPDNHKLRSCMTLFAQVADDPSLLNKVLDKFFGGPDQLTLDVLAGKTIVLPKRPTPKVNGIQRAQGAVASAGQRRGPAEPWTRERITSFVRGFGLSSVGTRQMVEAWMADQSRAWREGWELGHDEGVEDGWKSAR